MGNSSYPKAALKTAVTTGDLDQLRRIMAECDGMSGSAPLSGDHRDGALSAGVVLRTCTECALAGQQHQHQQQNAKKSWLLSQSLNKKGDCALALALRAGHLHLMDFLMENGSAVNAANREGETALDVLLGRVLPGEGDILHNHFCPYSHATDSSFRLPEEVKTMIRAGAKGSSLHKLVLHVMKDEASLVQVAELIPDLTSPDNYRLSGLVLQVAVWFDRVGTVVSLLERGVDPENFWRAPFIPMIVPNTEYRRTVDMWENMSTETEGEYVLSCPDKVIGVDSSAGLQSLKLSFVQDWRADWYDGENPDAQYRAGLLLTPDGAILLIKAANHHRILAHVACDVMQYIPPMCGGPDLKESPLIRMLTLAGYDFSKAEVVQLQLKYNMDFSEVDRFVGKPRCLKQLSRLVIRESLVHNAFVCVPQLTCLPDELRNYLFFSELAC